MHWFRCWRWKVDLYVLIFVAASGIKAEFSPELQQPSFSSLVLSVGFIDRVFNCAGLVVFIRPEVQTLTECVCGHEGRDRCCRVLCGSAGEEVWVSGRWQQRQVCCRSHIRSVWKLQEPLAPKGPQQGTGLQVSTLVDHHHHHFFLQLTPSSSRCLSILNNLRWTYQ